MNTVESVAVVPFFIPDVGVAYFVGHFNPEDIVLDDLDDDFSLRHNILNEEMEVFFSQEGVISWFEKNGYCSDIRFFCEFCNVFWNSKFSCEDCEYVNCFEHDKILEYLYPKH